MTATDRAPGEEGRLTQGKRTAAAEVERVAARVQPRPWLACWSLCRRELLRFFRQRNRVVGAIGQPVLFWLLFGVGLDRSFQLSEAGQGTRQSFQEYYVPGTLVLIVLFTAIFATISIIEDRKEGFLQSVLVAPVPRWAMVMGKVLGGAIIALLQALIFLLLALTIQMSVPWVSLLNLVAFLLVAAVALTSLGFVLAWRMESTQGFHAIMSVLLMPMWLLSGAFFPVPVLDSTATVAQSALHGLMRLNPVTYSVAGVRHLMFAPESVAPLALPSLTTCWVVTAGFAAIMFVAAQHVARYRVRGDLL